MFPFGMDPLKVMFLLLLALILYGPTRLPDIGRSFGRMLREFSGATREATQAFTEGASPTPDTSQAEREEGMRILQQDLDDDS